MEYYSIHRKLSPQHPSSSPIPIPLNLRDSILVFGGVALAGALVWMFTMGSTGVAGGNPVPAMERVPPSPDVPRDNQSLLPLEGQAPGSPMVGEVEKRRPDSLGMTSGLIRGDIALSPEVVQRITSIAVVVQELAASDGAGQPFSRTKKVTMGRGTPTFEIGNIPFSRNGFSVRVLSPGLNGSEQIVGLTETDPIADVVLGISSPVTFSVLLRDQFQGWVTSTKVIMQPVDLPLRRDWLNGETDNVGSVLFEEVLAGDYMVFVDNISSPLVEPVRVTVQPPGTTFQPEVAYVRGQPVKNQFTSITVPLGQALNVSVTGPAGYGLKDAKLSMLSTSSVRYQPYEGITDYNGRHVFPHLPPGEYQRDVELTGHQRWSRNVRWKDGEVPPQVVVRLIPLRKY